MKKAKYGIFLAMILGFMMAPTIVLGVDCGAIKLETSCWSMGCSWKNNTCVDVFDEIEKQCQAYTSQLSCQQQTSCSWNSQTSSCGVKKTTSSIDCSSYTNGLACNGSPNGLCYWDNNTCKPTLINPSSMCFTLTSKDECNSYQNGVCKWNDVANFCNPAGSGDVLQGICVIYSDEASCNNAPNGACYWDGSCKTNTTTGDDIVTKKTCVDYGKQSCPDEDEVGNSCVVKGSKCVVDRGDIELYEKTSCGPINDIPSGLPTFTRNIVNALKILVPVILIIMGMIDFLRAVISNDEKNMKSSQSRFIRRAIAAVLVFFVVVIVQFVFGMIQSEDNILSCLNCFLSSDSGCVAGANSSLPILKCSNYKSERSCPETDEEGNLCTWKGNSCKKIGKAKNCKEFSGDDCPEKDNFGHFCKTFTNSAGTKTCMYKGNAKRCSDYSAQDCPSGKEDDYGSVCELNLDGTPFCEVKR